MLFNKKAQNSFKDKTVAEHKLINFGCKKRDPSY